MTADWLANLPPGLILILGALLVPFLPGVLRNNPETDVVIVMEGTNDLSDRDISTEAMRFNIEAMSDLEPARALDCIRRLRSDPNDLEARQWLQDHSPELMAHWMGQRPA